MTKNIAQAALLFMNRVEIKGSEVPAWVEVVNALRDIAEGKPNGKDAEASLEAGPDAG